MFALGLAALALFSIYAWSQSGQTTNVHGLPRPSEATSPIPSWVPAETAPPQDAAHEPGDEHAPEHEPEIVYPSTTVPDALGQTTLHDLVIPPSIAASPSPLTTVLGALNEPKHEPEGEHVPVHEPGYEQDPVQPLEPEIVHLTTTESAQLPPNMRIIKDILELVFPLDDVHLEVLKEILPVSIEIARMILFLWSEWSKLNHKKSS